VCQHLGAANAVYPAPLKHIYGSCAFSAVVGAWLSIFLSSFCDRMRNIAGRKGRSSSSSSNSSDGDSSAPPACRLSRPGSSVVRVIPPLRGLERQFRCSWCNTSLFTTANVIRTDLDLRPLVENFVLTAAPSMASPKASQGPGGVPVATEKKTDRYR
jgi:hypothetical protein